MAEAEYGDGTVRREAYWLSNGGEDEGDTAGFEVFEAQLNSLIQGGFVKDGVVVAVQAGGCPIAFWLTCAQCLHSHLHGSRPSEHSVNRIVCTLAPHWHPALC